MTTALACSMVLAAISTGMALLDFYAYFVMGRPTSPDNTQWAVIWILACHAELTKGRP